MRCVVCAWGRGAVRRGGLALAISGMVALASAQTPCAATVQLNDAAGTIEAEVLAITGWMPAEPQRSTRWRAALWRGSSRESAKG